jgi:hypothetical protein
VPNATTWRCQGCQRELGTANGPTLDVEGREGLRVLATPRGLIVTCPDCRAERLWTWRPARVA